MRAVSANEWYIKGRETVEVQNSWDYSNNSLLQTALQPSLFNLSSLFWEVIWNIHQKIYILYFFRDVTGEKGNFRKQNLDRFQLMSRFGRLNSFWAANKWVSLSHFRQIKISNNSSCSSRMKYKASKMLFLFHFFKKRTSHPYAFMSLSIACASYSTVH